MAKASISANNYVVTIGYDGTDGATANFLMPPLSTNVGEAIVVTVGLVYAGGSDWSTNPSYKFSNADFAFALVPEPGTKPPEQGSPGQYQSMISVQITIAANNVWKAAPAARAALMANWSDLLAKVDALELSGALIRGAAGFIAERVAALVPAPPMETLFYRFGLQPGFAGGQIATCDVLPGMQLRVEFEQNQFVGPGSNLNGYVGGAQLRWLVASSPTTKGWTSNFDPFLGAVAAPTVQTGSPVVAGGLIDLQRATASRRHIRLCYPQNIQSSDQAGSIALTDNVALLGADSRADLDAATAAVAQGKTPAAPATCTILRGRTLLVPEIPVWVLDSSNRYHEQWVPLGTTVANVLERYLQWRPLSPLAAMPLSLVRNIVMRSGPTVASESLSSMPLLFFSRGQNTPIDPASYDIPLMPGDRFGLVGASGPANQSK